MHKQLGSLRKFALSLPEAREDFPFGRPVIVIGKRPFLYLNTNREGAPTIAVKLPRSKQRALKLKCGTPTAYGLGRGGWVTIAMQQSDTPKQDVLRAWIEESYQELLKPNPVNVRIAAGDNNKLPNKSSPPNKRVAKKR